MVGLGDSDFNSAVFGAYQEQLRSQLPPAVVVDGDAIVHVIGEINGLFPRAVGGLPLRLSELPSCDLTTKLIAALARTSQSDGEITEEPFQISPILDPEGSTKHLKLVVFAIPEFAKSFGAFYESPYTGFDTVGEISTDALERHKIGRHQTPIVIMWKTDAEGLLTFVSIDETQFTGIANADLLGNGWHDALHPDDADQCLETFGEAIRVRQPFSFVSRKRRVDGEYVWFRTHGIPQYDRHGDFLGMNGICVDITEQNKFQSELVAGQRMRQELLDRCPFLCSYANVDMVYQYVNSRYADFWETPRDQIVGKGIPEVAGAFFETLKPYLKRVLEGETVFHESKVWHESGKTSLLEITHVPAFDSNGEVTGFYCFVNDITTPRKHDRLLNLVLSNVSAMVLLLNTDLELRYANQQFLHCLAKEEQQVFGRNIIELIGANEFSKAETCFELALKGRECTFEIEIPTPGKGSIAGLIKLVPEIEDGVVTGICGLVLDVSDLRTTQLELELSEAKFQLAVAGSSVGIMEFDNDNPHWAFADHIESLLGFDVGELKSSRHKIRELVHPDDFAVNSEFNKAIAAGVESKGELRLKTKAGEYRWFEIFTQPIRNNLKIKSSCVVGTIADINDLKSAQLESADQVRRRDEFLAMLSHELRNPMASIVMATECLHGADDMPQKFRRECDIIARQSRHISGLLNDLLDVSRVTLNRIELNKVSLDLNQSISDCVDNYLAISHVKQQRILLDLCDRPCRVVGDESRLAQVVSNLIDNAVKYTPIGGEILVSTDLRDDQVVLTVRDSGIGIAPEMLENIFDLFFQEDVSIHRGNGGLGVGLYLVKHIVESHGGSIVVRSEGAGHGCTFEITLPSMPVIPPRTSEIPKLETTPLKVVLVEDNDDARFVIAKQLSIQGIEVMEFAEGESASSTIPMICPDVAIIDIGLPGKSGLELAEEFRKDPNLGGMLLIALTGYGQQSDRDVIINAGFDLHLVKPVGISDIMQAIHKYESTSQSRQGLSTSDFGDRNPR